MEIVASIVAGYSNKEIARKFLISEDTVKHHVTNVFDKLGFITAWNCPVCHSQWPGGAAAVKGRGTKVPWPLHPCAIA